MAGRPANPTWATLSWAPDVNYAAGALSWSGTATKVAWAGAASVGFTPKVAVPAQAINYYFNHFAGQLVSCKTKIDEMVNFVGQQRALNFQLTTGVGSLEFAFFNPVNHNWVVVGPSVNERTSQDQGLTWGSGGLSVAGAGENVKGGDYAANGDYALCTDTRYVFTVQSGAVNKRDVFATAITALTSCIVHAPTFGRWCAAVASAASILVRTSNDGVTWTARTIPTGFFSDASIVMRMVSNKAGRIVWAMLAGTALVTSYSDDGGVTWAAGVTKVVPGFDQLGLAYDASSGSWMLTVGEVSGTPSGEIYRSADGATWTKTVTLTSSCLGTPAALGNGEWVAVANAGTTVGIPVIVYSYDDGLTWKKSGIRMTGTAKGAFAGSGGVLCLTASNIYMGQRMSEPGLGNIT